ncbi:hypothetical protein B0H14DRAFT_485651 [Mycena olivaceomarginata]|nr:hypothetical protein B0H14DRAFT_485651 [Mycena olivaceomarginata]
MVERKCETTDIPVPLDEETVSIAIVVPKHLCPHTHPPPSATRIPTDVRLLYEQAVRAYGISVAIVNKVEQASSTIEIMGAAPGLVHPSPLNVSTKQTIIAALKRHEPGRDKSGWEGDFLFSLVQKSKKTEAAVAPEPSDFGKKQHGESGTQMTKFTCRSNFLLNFRRGIEHCTGIPSPCVMGSCFARSSSPGLEDQNGAH